VGIIESRLSKEDAAKCEGHHYPNYCECFVYELQQRLRKLEAIKDAAKLSMTHSRFETHDGNYRVESASFSRLENALAEYEAQ
jgi:hypothetical protein